MKYNYPIKYATMPIVEQVGWSHGLNELERNYDVVCYIVSKCYLLGEKIKYKENGKCEKEYEIVFPYQVGKNYNYESNIPTFNHMSCSCVNSITVKDIYDNYDEALEAVNEKNKKLCQNSWIYLPYTEDLDKQIAKKTEEFNNKLSKYKKLEQLILANTSDLDQSNVRKLDKIIIKRDGKTKILSDSLYQSLNIFSYSDFIVYSISQEEYKNFIELFYDKDIPDILKHFKTATPILFHKASEENIMIINQDGNVFYNINKWGHLIKNDEQQKVPVKLPSDKNNTVILFTTEKLNDILISFKIRESIDINELNSKVLNKTLSKVSRNR